MCVLFIFLSLLLLLLLYIVWLVEISVASFHCQWFGMVKKTIETKKLVKFWRLSVGLGYGWGQLSYIEDHHQVVKHLMRTFIDVCLLYTCPFRLSPCCWMINSWLLNACIALIGASFGLMFVLIFNLTKHKTTTFGFYKLSIFAYIEL